MCIKFGISRSVFYGMIACTITLAVVNNAEAEENGEQEQEEKADAVEPSTSVSVSSTESVAVNSESQAAPTESATDSSASESTPAAESTEEEKSAGVNVDVGFSTIYNFRGLNTFMENSLMDQNALFAPSLTWSIFDTGLYLGYWGAYQLSGDNKSAMVDIGLGHEQDLFLGYDLGLANDLVTLSFAFTYIFYPFADETVAGTKNPSIIEPLVGISIATVLDLGLNISYFHSLQKEIKGLRHAYFKLSAGKSFSFNDTFGMDLGIALGIKAWVEDVDFNRVDLNFSWGIPIQLTKQLYVTPAVNLSWTDLKTVASGIDDDPLTADIDESTRNARAGDEYMIYASINFGADF